MNDRISTDANQAKKIALRALEIASGTQANQVAGGAGASVTNSAAIGAAASLVAPSAADFTAGAPGVVSSTTKRVRISGGVYAQHSAIDTAVTFQYIRDPAGAATLIGPVFTTDSGHVGKDASMTLPEFYDTPGAGVRVYGVKVATAAGTVTVLAANEACITATPTS